MRVFLTVICILSIRVMDNYLISVFVSRKKPRMIVGGGSLVHHKLCNVEAKSVIDQIDYMKMKRYAVDVRDTALQHREKNR